MRQTVKKWTAASLLASLILGLGCSCGGTAEEASGQAEIPQEIWGEMDEETKKSLTEPQKYIALTFDDGPKANTTGPLLDGLLERGAYATFFLIGEQIEGNEDLIRRMAAEGHQIGNHTYSHVRLLNADKDSVIEEIQKTEVILDHILGEDNSEYWLRPPYGQIDKSRAELVKTPMIYWSMDPEDWKKLDTPKVVEYVTSRVQPGDIILLHDFYPTSVEAALQIVDTLQEQGYSFVTVEELFRIQGVEPQPGVLYANSERTRSLN